MTAPPRIGVAYEIETPEDAVLAFRLAGPGTRLGAYLVDCLVRLLGLFALLTALGLFTPLDAAGGAPLGVWLVALFVAEWGYTTLFEALWDGRTPGKKLLGLRVLKEEGYSIGLEEALLRNLLRAADVLPFSYAVGLVSMVASPKLQRLGDLVAGTIVVCERRAPLRAIPAAVQEVESLPREQLSGVAAPAERTLALLEQFFRRVGAQSTPRTDEIAGLVAAPLARRLGAGAFDADAAARPTRFLLRVLCTFAGARPAHRGRSDT
jgi:uncharacterized RDD family membrane protein YckC